MNNTTTWNKDLFNYYSGYLTYGKGVFQSKFVARFKYTGRDQAGFRKFLIANFTPDEYFSRREAGETPVDILQSKGYISTTVKSLLKQLGYSPDQTGLQAHRKAQLEQLKLQLKGAV